MADPVGLRSWLLLAAAAVVVAALVGHVVSRAESTRARWGETSPVLVATRPLRAGDELRGATEVRQWPKALVPSGALSAPADAAARVGAALSLGAPLTKASLRRGDAESRGRPRMAVPLAEAHAALRPGDQVDVWSTTDPSLTEGGLDTERVTGGALVTAVGDRSVTLAVAPGDVEQLAAAGATATLTVVVLP